jgi:hypothetical protein
MERPYLRRAQHVRRGNTYGRLRFLGDAARPWRAGVAKWELETAMIADAALRHGLNPQHGQFLRGGLRASIRGRV